MKCPKCGFEQADQNTECLRCGIIFEKIHVDRSPDKISAAKSKAYAAAKSKAHHIEQKSVWSILKNLIFYVKAEINPFLFGGRIIFFLVIFIWGIIFIMKPMESNYVGESFWHLVNLPFHEAGHIIFRPLGRFMTSLGGSLGQLLMPLVCLLVFLIKTRDTFAASFSLWWLGESFMDLAPYINDARAGVLPLLGGNTGRTSPYGFHDWEFILKESGLIRYDHVIANMANGFGTALMIVAFLWGGYMLFKQYHHVKRNTL